MTPVNLLFHALWMLCGLGTVIFATAASRRWYGLGALALGFAVAVLSFPSERLPDPVWTGVLVALAAVLQLVRPGQIALTAVCGGALAGVWSSLLRIQGLPLPPALMLAAALPAISVWLAARRPAFAPAAVREEALLAVFGLGLAVAMAPGVLAGWRSALALNVSIDENSHVNQIVPAWTLLLGGASVALGGLYSLWTRR